MIDQTGANPSALTPANAQKILAKRAQSLAAIRAYFAANQVLEVETPLLGSFAVSDPQLDNIRIDCPPAISDTSQQSSWYLQTSPEFAMKKLLALGSGSIYQITRAFRQDPVGRLHAPEFTMLEWYRVGYDMQALMDDVNNLLVYVVGERAVEKISYRDAFLRYADIDPFTAGLDELKEKAKQNINVSFEDDSRETWLDLLLTHCVEPNLGNETYTFLYHYPPGQAAMAQISNEQQDGLPVALRFELYINGVEIANGYQELNDPAEQRKRFEADNIKRQQMGKQAVLFDEEFLRAMERGLPDCSGVALGVDRLIMISQTD